MKDRKLSESEFAVRYDSGHWVQGAFEDIAHVAMRTPEELKGRPAEKLDELPDDSSDEGPTREGLTLILSHDNVSRERKTWKGLASSVLSLGGWVRSFRESRTVSRGGTTEKRQERSEGHPKRDSLLDRYERWCKREQVTSLRLEEERIRREREMEQEYVMTMSR